MVIELDNIPFVLTSNGASALYGLMEIQGHPMLKSWITIRKEDSMFKRIVHPGLILKDELEEFAITPTEFARQIDVPPNRVSQIISGKRSITGDTALRFGHWFGVDPEFWLNLQAQFELAIADRETGDIIRKLPTNANIPPAADQPRLV